MTPGRRPRWWGWTLAFVLAAACALGLAGCGTVGYLAQSVGGHLTLMSQARPVQDVIDDPSTSPKLRARLELTQRMRAFSIGQLHEPDNNSYRRYADLKRPAAVWNVVAAPELSLTLKTSCFPVVGCIGYRGYFDKATADREADRLRAEGYEVAVYGVPAYSTLGWSNLFGGDPLLSTFIGYPEGELSRMIFHELAHQVAYAPGDTMFNESFATAVEGIGAQRWLAQATPEARDDYARYEARRRDFQKLTQDYHDRFDALYKSSASDDEKRAKKAALMAQMRADYADLKATRWDGYKGYDGWFERANNAELGVLAAYADLVPQFQQLFDREGGDFDKFYGEVKRLAKLPRKERRAELGVPAKP